MTWRVILQALGAGLKAVWFGAEAFGNVIGMTKDKSDVGTSTSAAAAAAAAGGGKLERARALELMKEDYDSSYFVSGVGDLAAYDPDCEFSDPFVAFKAEPYISIFFSSTLASLKNDV